MSNLQLLSESRRESEAIPPAPPVATGSRLAYLALAGVLLLLVLGLALLPQGVLWHPDEGAKLLQLYNLRLDGLLPAAPIAYPGRDLDPALSFVPFHPKQYRVDEQGNITLQWPIFLALLTAPFYSLLGMVGLYAWPLLGAAAACFLAWRLALAIGTPPRWAWLAIPLLALGTPLGFYSWLFFEHTLAACLVAASALLLLRARESGAGNRELRTSPPRPSPTRRGEPDRLPPASQQTTDKPPLHPGEGAGGEIRSSRLPAPGSRLLFFSGLLLGLAIYLRSELYVLAAVFVALQLWWLLSPRLLARRTTATSTPDSVLSTGTSELGTRNSELIYWLAGLLLALVPLWIYNALSGGGILPYHATWYFAGGEPVGGASGPRLPEIRYLAQVGWGVIPAFLVGPDNAGGPTVSDALSLGVVLSTLLAMVGGLLPWLNRDSAGLRRLADWLFVAGLIGLGVFILPVLFSPEPYVNLHGFVLAAPVIALAPLAARPEMSPSARALGALALLYIVGHVLVISALSGLDPISTYEWGQRYILPAYALLVPLAVRALPVLADRARGVALPALGLAAAGLLLFVGAGFMLRGWMALDAGKRDVAAWQSIVAANHDPALLTADWWLPLLLAPQFNKHRWYMVEDQADLQRWLAEVGRERVETAAVATVAVDPVGDYLPVEETVEGPDGFKLTRRAAIARTSNSPPRRDATDAPPPRNTGNQPHGE